MSRQTWLSRLTGIGLALALCSWATAARADDPPVDPDPPVDSEPPPADDSLAVPELDPRGASLALTILGGALLVLNGRRKRGTSGAV